MVTANATVSFPVGKGSIVMNDLDKVKVMIPGWNLRDATEEAHSNPDVETIAIIGQKEPVLLYRISQADLDSWGAKYVPYGVVAGDLLPIRGNIRSTIMKRFRKDGRIDPLTVKRDENGEVIAGSGKVFQHIRGEVVENLDEQVIFSLMNDHTSKRLAKDEVHKTIERATQHFSTEKQVAISLFGLLLATSKKSPSKKQTAIHTDEGQKAWLEFNRGRIQTAKRTLDGPPPLREAYLAHLRGEAAHPIQSEVETGYKIFRDERDKAIEAGDLSITKDSPGKAYLAWWEEFTNVQAAAEDTGEKARSISMLNAAQVKEKLKGASSLAFRIALRVVLNQVHGDGIVAYDRLLVAIEQANPEFVKQLTELNAKYGAATEVVEKPAADKPAADKPQGK